MSNNKQSGFYYHFELLVQGINTKNTQETIFNAFKKLENRVASLEYTNRNLETSLVNKKKVISKHEEESEIAIRKYYEVCDRLNSVNAENNILKETNKEYEEEITLMQSNVIDKEALINELKEASVNSIMDDFKSGGEISDYILEILYPKLCKENKTLKENVKSAQEFAVQTRIYHVEKCDKLEEENKNFKQKVKDLDMKILNESLNKASWHNTYEADIQALKGNLQCIDNMNKNLKEENNRLAQFILNKELKFMHFDKVKEENEKLKQEIKDARDFKTIALHDFYIVQEENEKLKQDLKISDNTLKLLLNTKISGVSLGEFILKHTS
jgi:hypothetical protein